jgi:deoxycytidylate deaminase
VGGTSRLLVCAINSSVYDAGSSKSDVHAEANAIAACGGFVGSLLCTVCYALSVTHVCCYACLLYLCEPVWSMGSGSLYDSLAASSHCCACFGPMQRARLTQALAHLQISISNSTARTHSTSAHGCIHIQTTALSPNAAHAGVPTSGATQLPTSPCRLAHCMPHIGTYHSHARTSTLDHHAALRTTHTTNQRADAARAGVSTSGATIYITMPPCKTCFGLLQVRTLAGRLCRACGW